MYKYEQSAKGNFFKFETITLLKYKMNRYQGFYLVH